MAKNFSDSIWWQIIVLLLGLVGTVSASYLHIRVQNIEKSAEVSILLNKSTILAEIRDTNLNIQKTISSIDKKVDINTVYLNNINKKVDRHIDNHNKKE